jgi:hypothetical protein
MYNVDFDKRHKNLLTLLDEFDLRLKVNYVREDNGRVYFHFSGDYESQAGPPRVEFSKKFGTEVVCSLYDTGYLELTEQGVRPPWGSGHLREIMAKLEGSGRQEVPELRITAKARSSLALGLTAVCPPILSEVVAR